MRTSALTKVYSRSRTALGPARRFTALDSVDFRLRRGAITVLVGESGSGKSTLARCLAKLDEPTSGEVWYKERPLASVRGKELLQFRAEVQLIFQDAGTALNPSFSALEVVLEPMRIQGRPARELQREKAIELLAQAEIPARWANRFPSQFSGGQRQRLALARALALQPELLILDESLSGLDLSIQHRILDWLLDTRQQREITLLFVAHDLSLARRIADDLVVMHQGKIVEAGEARQIFERPRHPQTSALLAAYRLLNGHAIPGPHPA
jgi:peptide/nickel transport system ATP-binding protein